MDDIGKLITGVGFPIAVLIFVGWGLVRSSMWLGVNMILPLVKRIVDFIDTLQATVVALTKAMDSLHVLQEESTKAVMLSACRYPTSPEVIKRQYQQAAQIAEDVNKGVIS